MPLNVRAAVEKQLQNSGIQACRIRLEHNVGGTQVELVSPPSGGCPCEPVTNLTTLPPRPYVRLSLCVPWTELMPNCLAKFGFDVSDPSKIADSMTVFRYELQ